MISQPTLRKFQYPSSLVKEYQHWLVLLRPKQVTLGSLILICKDDAKSFGKISPEAFAELKLITNVIEVTLNSLFTYDKINYLMLMMVDPEVHFHVIPRYDKDRKFDQTTFTDPGWPKAADMDNVNEITKDQFKKLRTSIKDNWR